MDIARCTADDLAEWVLLRQALWPDEPDENSAAEARAMLAEPELLALLCRDAGGQPIGFAEASLRRDYVNGCLTRPVAFLEGIYVAPGHRRRGVARALCGLVAEWGRANGCSELASDALLANAASHAMHAALGFAETERVVFFRQRL
jgi:aminoglycoside 6'-N-acetyltransferase I